MAHQNKYLRKTLSFIMRHGARKVKPLLAERCDSNVEAEFEDVNKKQLIDVISERRKCHEKSFSNCTVSIYDS